MPIATREDIEKRIAQLDALDPNWRQHDSQWLLLDAQLQTISEQAQQIGDQACALDEQRRAQLAAQAAQMLELRPTPAARPQNHYLQLWIPLGLGIFTALFVTFVLIASGP